eukprot:TRINITY_DN537_c0_g1_i1.p6 TRINITY_DN537_c0_g1~~TRINITY_DN537_c0_g1_i1.p6  ORF type:complete len:140 (+),score=18.87 TRINITY_DN537_c0_g1_i1:1063-1482(+)
MNICKKNAWQIINLIFSFFFFFFKNIKKKYTTPKNPTPKYLVTKKSGNFFLKRTPKFFLLFLTFFIYIFFDFTKGAEISKKKIDIFDDLIIFFNDYKFSFLITTSDLKNQKKNTKKENPEQNQINAETNKIKLITPVQD